MEQMVDRDIRPIGDKESAGSLPLRIREAHLTDVEPMLGLLRTLFALEPDFTFNPLKLRKGLVQLICQDQGKCVLVAEVGLRIVGMCTAQRVISTAEGGPVAWVEDVVVDPAYQHKGVGRWLLMTLEQWAVAQGMKRLQLLADQDNVGAMAFYTKQGWNSTRMHAWRKFLG
jgi:GNAT superfamily N-acetyltransferase